MWFQKFLAWQCGTENTSESHSGLTFNNILVALVNALAGMITPDWSLSESYS